MHLSDVYYVVLEFLSYEFSGARKVTEVGTRRHFVHARKSKTIPPYLHFLQEDEITPMSLKASLKNCLRINSDLKVTLWTRRSAKLFLQKYFPVFYPIYVNYESKEQKADSVRYFLLYYYGGK